MAENQNIEWKESWRDEYLKWICGFANAQGGKIYIGKNDNGTTVGISNSKKLLEDIPNKVRDVLGIIVDVNLEMEDGKEYIIGTMLEISKLKRKLDVTNQSLKQYQIILAQTENIIFELDCITDIIFHFKIYIYTY